MLSQNGISVQHVGPERTVLQSNVKMVVPRLRNLPPARCVAAIDRHARGHLEVAAALQLINTVILPPPHLFVAELRNQAQFLMPQVGAEAVGSNFIALTAIWASLRRVLIGLALAFVCAVILGSLAFYFNIFGKLTLPTVTLLAPIASVAWIPLAIFAFGSATGRHFCGIYQRGLHFDAGHCEQHAQCRTTLYRYRSRFRCQSPPGNPTCDFSGRPAEPVRHHADQFILAPGWEYWRQKWWEYAPAWEPSWWPDDR